MTKNEIYEFIEEMESMGDSWTYEQAKDVYGNKTLDDAFASRRTAITHFNNIIGTVLNA